MPRPMPLAPPVMNAVLPATTFTGTLSRAFIGRNGGCTLGRRVLRGGATIRASDSGQREIRDVGSAERHGAPRNRKGLRASDLCLWAGAGSGRHECRGGLLCRKRLLRPTHESRPDHPGSGGHPDLAADATEDAADQAPDHRRDDRCREPGYGRRSVLPHHDRDHASRRGDAALRLHWSDVFWRNARPLRARARRVEIPRAPRFDPDEVLRRRSGLEHPYLVHPVRAGALQGQQPRLDGEATAEAGKGAVGSDHPVAGHNDGNGISPVRRAYGAHRLAAADLIGYLSVTAGFTKGYGAQGLPDLVLELRAAGVELYGERTAFAGKVFLKLLLRLAQKRMSGVLGGSPTSHP